MSDHPLVDIIAGARPNFMKIAPIIKAMEARKAEGGRLRYRLVHTGQHYDARMSGDFFEQLGIPAPDMNLEVGSGTQAEQTAAIMTRYERLLIEQPAALCLVVGDVTSTMACAITAQKLKIPVAHVEGGIRSGDWSMPEEINRMATDAVTNWFFTTSETANANLRRIGVGGRAHLLRRQHDDRHAAWRIWTACGRPTSGTSLGLAPGNYLVVTLHRPSNVDEEAHFARLLAAIGEGARDLAVIFPVHPRSQKMLAGIAGLPGNLRFVDPQPYLEFNYLVRHAKAVITDSGGVTEETTVMGVPCMTLRDTTERPETVEIGTNEILGTDPAGSARRWSGSSPANGSAAASPRSGTARPASGLSRRWSACFKQYAGQHQSAPLLRHRPIPEASLGVLKVPQRFHAFPKDNMLTRRGFLVLPSEALIEADKVTNEGAKYPHQRVASNSNTESDADVLVCASVASAERTSIASGVKAIRTQFFAPTFTKPSTLVGGASYARVSKVDIDAVGYPSAAFFRSADRNMPDGTTDATNGGYWLLLEDVLMPEMFGATGDGKTDDSAAIAAAIALAATRGGGEVLFGPRTYNIGSTTIAFADGVIPRCSHATTIRYWGIGTAIEINASVAPEWRGAEYQIPFVIRGARPNPDWNDQSDTTTVGVCIKAMAYSGCYLFGARSFNQGVRLEATSSNIVCNTFTLGRIVNNRIGLYLKGSAAWGVNQNIFLGGACIIDSAYTAGAGRWHVYMEGPETNGNTFVGTNLEQGSAGTRSLYCDSSDNAFFNVRWEGIAETPGAIEFTTTANCNKIIGYTPISGNDGPFETWINDTGRANCYWFGEVLMSKSIRWDFAYPALFFGGGTANPTVPIGGYGADRMRFGNASTTGFRHYGYWMQEETVRSSGLGLPKNVNHVQLDYVVPAVIEGFDGGFDAGLAGIYSVTDLNGNITLKHTASPASGAGKIVLKAESDLALTAKQPIVFIFVNGNLHQV